MNDFNSLDYWKDRHVTMRGSIQSVGNCDWSDELNQELVLSRIVKLEESLRSIDLRLEKLKVLDAGCGIGLFTEWLCENNARAVGIDVAPVAIEEAKQRCPNASFYADPIHMFNKEKDFDLIVCVDVIYHIVEDEIWEKTLKNLAGLLKNKGYLFLSDRFGEKEIFDGHIKSRTWETYKPLLKNLRLEMIQTVPYDFSFAENYGLPKMEDLCSIGIFKKLEE